MFLALPCLFGIMELPHPICFRVAVAFNPRPCLTRHLDALRVRAQLGANGQDHIHGQRPRSARFHRRAWRFRRANRGTPEKRRGCSFSFAFRFSLFSSFLLPGNEHASEAGFISHHPSVCFGRIASGTVSMIGRTPCSALKESVSSASIEDPVIVPAIERVPKRSGTGLTLIGSSPPTPATISWPRGASPASNGDMALLFAAVARISRAPPRV